MNFGFRSEPRSPGGLTLFFSDFQASLPPSAALCPGAWRGGAAVPGHRPPASPPLSQAVSAGPCLVRFLNKILSPPPPSLNIYVKLDLKKSQE